jgi:uncharacterized damage-inducible protein DinB
MAFAFGAKFRPGEDTLQQDARLFTGALAQRLPDSRHTTDERALMNRLEHLKLAARYNQWMNDKLFAAAQQLGNDAVRREAGAFFGSIWGTLNHLAVADTLWLQRLARHESGFASLSAVRALPTPTSLDQQVAGDLAGLQARRSVLDDALIRLSQELTEAHLNCTLRYQSTKGLSFAKGLHDVLLHVFNHQTHHRGQATTLFTQAGMDVGATDLLLLIPDIED